MADTYIAGSYTFDSKEAGAIHRPRVLGLWLDGSTFRDLSKTYPMPVQSVDSAGNSMDGALTDAAWDLTTGTSSKRSIDKKKALLLEDIRAAVTNTTAVSLVKKLNENAREDIAIIAPGFTTTATADTLLNNFQYTIDGGANNTSLPANYTVPAGKRLIVKSITAFLTLPSGHTTAGGARITVRWGTATITTSSPQIGYLIATYGTSASSMTAMGPSVQFPEGGFELKAGAFLGASVAMTIAWANNTNMPTVFLMVHGHLYDDTP